MALIMAPTKWSMQHQLEQLTPDGALMRPLPMCEIRQQPWAGLPGALGVAKSRAVYVG